MLTTELVVQYKVFIGLLGTKDSLRYIIIIGILIIYALDRISLLTMPTVLKNIWQLLEYTVVGGILLIVV